MKNGKCCAKLLISHCNEYVCSNYTKKLIFSQINTRAILQDHKMWPSCDIYGLNNFPSDNGMLHVPHQSLGPTMSLKDWLGNYDDIAFKDENWPH